MGEKCQNKKTLWIMKFITDIKLHNKAPKNTKNEI